MANEHINFEQIIKWTENPDLLLMKLSEWKLIAKEGEVQCDRCDLPMKLYTIDGAHYWRCMNKRKNSHKKTVKCDKRVTIKRNSFFDNSHLSFKQILIFVHEWLHFSEINKIMLETRISSRSATNWNDFAKDVTIEFVFNGSKKIGGPGKIVEIDESKFGKRKYHRGHAVEGQWVFGGVDRESGDFFLVPVEKRDAETLIKLVKEYIVEGSIIYSDCWRAYNTLKSCGFQHYTVNHSLNFKDPETGVHTNTIEGLWRHAKHRIPEYRRNKNEYLGYFAKYIFISHCRKHNLDRFSEFMKAAGIMYRAYGISVDDSS